MKDKIIEGICCEYCIHQLDELCPVKQANPWSRWKNFCNEFVDNEGKSIFDLSITPHRTDEHV